MLFQSTNKNFATSFTLKSLAVPLLLFWFGAAAVFAQTPTGEQTATVQTKTEEAPKVLMPIIQDYKGIKIGMTIDEVEDKLGKPKVEDATSLFYALSDDESVQIALDKDKTVRVISVMYSKSEAAPKYEDVFGKDAKVAAQPDGSIYNLMQYPEAGYWVIYSRSAGDSPMIIVTLQEMPETESAKSATSN